MKKIYSLLFLSLFSFSVFGQLNGSYQVGGTAPDYASLTTAVNALHTQGISGPVTFNIEPGTYNEQLMLGYIQGTNPSDTILFTSSTGNPEDVTIEYSHASPDNYIMKFDSTAHVCFSRVTFNSLGTDGEVVELSNAVQGLRLKENRFLAPPDVTQIFRDEPDIGHPSRDIYIVENTFKGGRIGVEIDNHYSNDSKFALIKGNSFINQKFGAIFLTNFDDLFTSNDEGEVLIQGNEILYDTTVSYNYTAIYVRHIYDSLNVSNNLVRARVGDFHFRCFEQDNNGGTGTKVWYNNVCDVELWHSGGYVTGISSTNGSGHSFIHNTFVFRGVLNGFLQGIYIGNSGGGTDLINNDFTILGSSSAYYMRTSNSSPGLGTVDNNNLFSEGDVFADLDGSIAATFSDYQDSTGWDLNSLNQMSGVAIHDTGSVDLCSYDLYGGGMPSFVNTDFNGEVRSSTSPTPGALEVYSNSPSVSSQASELEGCQYSYDTLSGGYFANGKYHWKRGDDTLGWGQEVIATIPDTGAYYVMKWEQGVCQASDSVFIQGYPAISNELTDTGFCAGDDVILDAGNWSSYQWWGVGDTMQTITVDSSATYYVEVMDSNGCEDGEYIYVAEWNLPVIDSLKTIDASCSSCCDGIGVVYPQDDSSSFDFQWTGGSTNDTATNLCVGQVTVTVTDSNGCEMTDTSTVDFTLGQKELGLSSGMEVYPNPSNAPVNLKIKGTLQKDLQGRILDLNGRAISVFQVPAGTRGYELQLPEDAAGIYYLELSNEHQVMMGKLVVE